MKCFSWPQIADAIVLAGYVMHLDRWIKDDIFDAAVVKSSSVDLAISPMVKSDLGRRGKAKKEKQTETKRRETEKENKREKKREDEREQVCALCQLAIVVSDENQLMLSFFVTNAKRYDNPDPLKRKKQDQRTTFFLDKDYVMQPKHAARVPQNLLTRDSAAKLMSPANDVHARFAADFFYVYALAFVNHHPQMFFKAACTAIVKVLRHQGAWVTVGSFSVL